jgi:hypothetical protein
MYARELWTVRLSSNEGIKMKGARRREPRRTRRFIRLTLVASAIYAVFAARTAFAQPSQFSNRGPSAFDHPDATIATPATGNASSGLNAGSLPASSPGPNPNANRRHFDGGFVRAQHRVGRGQSGNVHDQHPIPAMPVSQNIPPPDPEPAARPPRHTVMTPDERRLLRQHIEEAVRDLYKR